MRIWLSSVSMNRNDQHTKYSWEQTEALKLLFFPAENKLSQVLKPFNYAQFIELRFILTALRTNFCSHMMMGNKKNGA